MKVQQDTRKILLLDVMSTLVYDPFYKEMPAFFGMNLQELISQIKPGEWVTFEHGHIDENTFLCNFFADGRSYDHSAFMALLHESYAWLDGIESLLQELNAQDVEMHTFSNYPVWYKIIEDRLQLSQYLPWTFVSCKSQLRKPAKEAYLYAAETLGVQPQQCLFVDDRGSNCKAALEVGMDTHRFESANGLRQKLLEAGFLQPGE